MLSSRAFLPSLLVSELTVCVVLFGGLAAVLAVGLAPEGEASAASPSVEVTPIRDISLVGPAADRLTVLFDDHCLIQEIDGPGQSLVWLKSGDERVTAIAGSSKEDRVALADSTGRLRVLDLTSDTAAWETILPGEVASSAVFSPDGRTLAFGTQKGAVVLLDAATGELCHRIGTGAGADSLAFTPDGLYVVAAAPGGIDLWDVETGRRTHHLPGTAAQITAVGVSADGGRAVAVTVAGEVAVWDLRVGKLTACRQVDAYSLLSVAFGPDGDTILAGSITPSIGVYAAGDLGSVAVLDGHRFGTRGLLVRGDRLLSAGLDGRIRVRNVRSSGRDLPLHSVAAKDL